MKLKGYCICSIPFSVYGIADSSRDCYEMNRLVTKKYNLKFSQYCTSNDIYVKISNEVIYGSYKRRLRLRCQRSRNLLDLAMSNSRYDNEMTWNGKSKNLWEREDDCICSRDSC